MFRISIILAFTGVLAIACSCNRQKAPLDQFEAVNNSLEQANKQFQSKSEEGYQKIDSIYKAYPSHNENLYTSAAELKKLSAETISYIDSLKKVLLVASDDAGANYDAATKIMIDEGKGTELRGRVVNYKQEAIALVNDAEARDRINSSNLVIADAGPDKSDKWESLNFGSMPLAAVITNLSKLQADVKNTEMDILNALLKDKRK